MATEASKFKVGLIIIIGLVLGVGAVIWLGVSRFFEETEPYVTYVDESVQGLSKDSPVKYQGVRIGRVSQIEVAPDGNLIEVVMQIEDQKFTLRSNMRAQLAAAGITGIMYLEISQIDPKDPPPPPPKLSFKPPYPLIASRPSGLHALIGQLTDIFKGLKEVDYAGISAEIKKVLEGTDQLLKGPRLNAIMTNIEESSASLRRILADERWEKIVGEVEGTTSHLESAGGKVDAFLDNPQLKESLEDLKVSAKSIRDLSVFLEEKVMAIELGDRVNLTLERFSDMGLEGAQAARNLSELVNDLHLNLYVTVENLRKTSENLKRLSDMVETQPSLLLFSEPPKEKE